MICLVTLSVARPSRVWAFQPSPPLRNKTRTEEPHCCLAALDSNWLRKYCLQSSSCSIPPVLSVLGEAKAPAQRDIPRPLAAQSSSPQTGAGHRRAFVVLGHFRLPESCQANLRDLDQVRSRFCRHDFLLHYWPLPESQPQDARAIYPCRSRGKSTSNTSAEHHSGDENRMVKKPKKNNPARQGSLLSLSPRYHQRSGPTFPRFPRVLTLAIVAKKQPEAIQAQGDQRSGQ